MEQCGKSKSSRDDSLRVGCGCSLRASRLARHVPPQRKSVCTLSENLIYAVFLSVVSVVSVV